MNTIQIIQEELQSKNIKPSRMMKDLGFSSGLFSQWKKGQQKPSADKLQKVAEYLNVSIDYLLGKSKNDLEEITTNNSEDFVDLNIIRQSLSPFMRKLWDKLSEEQKNNIKLDLIKEISEESK